jgi:hypothetical protein
VTFTKCVCVVLLTALLVMVVQPGRAEALDPIVISLIVSAGICVIALVAILVIANMSEGRMRSSQPVSPPLVAYAIPASVFQSP